MEDIQHDGSIDIATGASVRSKTWRNKKWNWGDLVKRLMEANHTNEKYKEYLRYTKAEQGKIKDVGGYVGAYLRSGRRKPNNVQHRQLMTLDIDFARLDFWDDFIRDFDNAAVLHGTHKHSDKTPRYRLVMPFAREVSSDEYVAISRAIAGVMGIDLFDNTGFQPERLMFWPSTSADMEYYVKFQDGPWIDPDEILSSYIDWKDSSLWPTSVAESDRVGTLAEKQADPEEKRGIVGAFCRAYTIEDVLEQFLSDEYVEAMEGRYTYLQGSAAAGLVTYNNRFAYSHHGTDPSSGKLCNAFDLVRLHKFGHLDPDSVSRTQKSASFKAMEELALKDKTVKAQIARDLMDSVNYDFAEPIAPELIEGETEQGDTPEKEEISIDWMENLEIDGRGKYLSSATNLNTIFAKDQRLQNIFKYNSFDGKRYVCSSLPWRSVSKPEPIENVDYSGIRNYLETMYGIVGNLKIDDSLALEFKRHSYNPVKDYLEGLKWDGVARVDTALVDFFGAEDSTYTREAMRKTLVGGVGRIFNPGIKFDLVLSLVGGEGTGKSTFVKALGREWASDTFMTISGKEAFEQLQGAWVIEIAELAGFRKSEDDQVKQFLTKQEDSFRPAYGRVVEIFPRQCIFIATTNNKDFLRSPTGNRRFIPIAVDPSMATKDILRGDLTDEYVSQLWAEAVVMYRGGETLFMSPEAKAQARTKQRDHSETDQRKGLIEDYLDKLLPESWDDKTTDGRRTYLSREDDLSEEGTLKRELVCVPEIWCECLGRPKEDMDRYKTRPINDILRSLEGWEQSTSTKNFPLYGKQKYYRRI